MAKPYLSEIVQEQIKRPSPIRQIMKMADRKNIINMGLVPDEVISFGGGWVDHSAPEPFRERYVEICSSPDDFHISGGYGPTLGTNACREMVAGFERKIFGTKNIEPENIIIGQSSTQIAHDAFIALADPNDPILLFDPTYANYPGQLTFALRDFQALYLRVLDTSEWRYMPDVNDIVDGFNELCARRRPKFVLFPSPDNPTSQIIPDGVVKAMLEIAAEKGSFVVIDHAYKTQYFSDSLPEYFSFSPNDYENLITLHSNSKWCRGLGRRLGWLEGSREVIDAMERVQQCSILCPDSLHQMAMARYLEESLADGSLKKYLDETRNAYRKVAEFTVRCIDRYIGLRRLVPQGGLYTVIDVERNANELVPELLKNTGVLFIPGAGFGESLRNAVRISYGPLVNDPDKIKEGMERVGKYIN